MKPNEYLNLFFCWYDTAEYLENYYARREALRVMFEDYISATAENREIMNRLLMAHATVCKGIERKHNAFVLRYVAGANVKEISRIQQTALRTVHRDISHVFENMMLLAFGMMPPSKKPDIKPTAPR